jgi:hypothetical protein
VYGGESGIRTHVTLSSKHAFQACAFSHSAISPAISLLHEFTPQVVSCGEAIVGTQLTTQSAAVNSSLRFYVPRR